MWKSTGRHTSRYNNNIIIKYSSRGKILMRLSVPRSPETVIRRTCGGRTRIPLPVQWGIRRGETNLEITRWNWPGRFRRTTPDWWAACPAEAVRSPRTPGWPSPTVSDRDSPPVRRTWASRSDGNSNSPALSCICDGKHAGDDRVNNNL